MCYVLGQLDIVVSERVSVTVRRIWCVPLRQHGKQYERRRTLVASLCFRLQSVVCRLLRRCLFVRRLIRLALCHLGVVCFCQNSLWIDWLTWCLVLRSRRWFPCLAMLPLLWMEPILMKEIWYTIQSPVTLRLRLSIEGDGCRPLRWCVTTVVLYELSYLGRCCSFAASISFIYRRFAA